MTSALVQELRQTLTDIVRPLAGKGPAALIDFPNHGNVGDSAIWLGELELLDRLHGRPPAYVSTHRNCDFDYLKRFDGPILLHGGGNLGDLWPLFQTFREKVLRQFPGRPIVQLPQTIHFDSQERLDDMRRIVAEQGAFTLLVRDLRSLEIARTFDCEVQLAPDSAFMLDLDRIGTPVHDVLYLHRQDKERGAPRPAQPGWHEVDWVAETRPDWRRYRRRAIFAELRHGRFDRHRIREMLYRQLATERVKRGVALLSSGRSVVTDRLHAHILSTLLDIPHRVLDNSYGKVAGFATTWRTTRDGASGEIIDHF